MKSSKPSAVSRQRSALWNRLPACEASVSYQPSAYALRARYLRCRQLSAVSR
ncbi:hypothetical protein [Moorena sp. SIO3I6]|uniref:hypothetical protein n=1 Tax=Moorena sp. SIO3I6 TaxID=2607831 RepID=UPI0013FB40CD|nr:hypothetical protein [Moorena sp. SIO3I6]NEP28863.1 hypothetical protein [Moorena sp. SIO3I6]